MQRLFIFALVWLAGSAPALAHAVTNTANWSTKGESLSYNVYWGPLSLGKANLSFTPQKNSYSAQARVVGRMPFFSMDDTWVATGQTTKTGLVSQQYRAMQAENDYRANKRLTFNHAAHTMLYENLHDANEPKLTVKLPQGGQDPFTALYDLRRNGLPKHPLSRQVMGLKRPFTLQFGVPEPQTINGEKFLKITLRKTDPAKPGTETWHILLTDDAELIPVEIDAQLKIGSFRAVLDDGKPAPRQQENIQ